MSLPRRIAVLTTNDRRHGNRSAQTATGAIANAAPDPPGPATSQVSQVVPNPAPTNSALPIAVVITILTLAVLASLRHAAHPPER
jgi:hypothetical protein